VIIIDGYLNGNLFYYDKNNQLPHPPTSEAIHSFVLEHLLNSQATSRRATGFICGWIAALCENNPKFFFTSISLSEVETSAF
jgi:hypothetical protein